MSRRWQVCFHVACNVACGAYFALLFYRQAQILSDEFSLLEALLGLVCLLLAALILFRPFAVAARTDAAALAVCGLCKTYYWLFDLSAEGGQFGSLHGSLLMTAGLVCWILSLLWLGKNFSILPALRQIQVNGPYRFLRHPIYFSYILIDLGLLCAFPSLRNAAVAALGVWLYGVRAVMEERLLGTHEAYREYCRRTKYRLIPFAY